jgi:hypothetical protein
VKYLLTRTMVLAILGLSALGSIGVADAAATGGGSAADTVTALEGQGYDVQINGSAHQPLSQCTVTGVHGVSNTDANGARIVPDQFNTAYVDVDCPGDS